MGKLLDSVVNDYAYGKYAVDNKPRFSRLDKHYIIDATQTLEWNAQEVIKHNDKNKKEFADYRVEVARLYDKFVQDVCDAIMVDYDMKLWQARLLYRFCKDEWDKDMMQALYYCEEIANLYKILNKKEGDNESNQ